MVPKGGPHMLSLIVAILQELNKKVDSSLNWQLGKGVCLSTVDYKLLRNDEGKT